MKRIGLGLIVLISVCGSSCGEYELLEHQKLCKRRADSTYRAHLTDLAKETDSICRSEHDKNYQSALDSLIPLRIEEMKMLIDK